MIDQPDTFGESGIVVGPGKSHFAGETLPDNVGQKLQTHQYRA